MSSLRRRDAIKSAKPAMKTMETRSLSRQRYLATLLALPLLFVCRHCAHNFRAEAARSPKGDGGVEERRATSVDFRPEAKPAAGLGEDGEGSDTPTIESASEDEGKEEEASTCSEGPVRIILPFIQCGRVDIAGLKLLSRPPRKVATLDLALPTRQK